MYKRKKFEYSYNSIAIGQKLGIKHKECVNKHYGTIATIGVFTAKTSKRIRFPDYLSFVGGQSVPYDWIEHALRVSEDEMCSIIPREKGIHLADIAQSSGFLYREWAKVIPQSIEAFSKLEGFNSPRGIIFPRELKEDSVIYLNELVQFDKMTAYIVCFTSVRPSLFSGKYDHIIRKSAKTVSKVSCLEEVEKCMIHILTLWLYYKDSKATEDIESSQLGFYLSLLLNKHDINNVINHFKSDKQEAKTAKAGGGESQEEFLYKITTPLQKVFKDVFTTEKTLGVMNNPSTGIFECSFHVDDGNNFEVKNEEHIQAISNDIIYYISNYNQTATICNYFKYLNEYTIPDGDGNEENSYEKLGNLFRLSLIDIKNAKSSVILTYLDRISTTVRYLHISNGPIKTIPHTIGTCTLLTELDLSNLAITDLPMEMSNLLQLRDLTITGNVFSNFPKVIKELPSLVVLRFSAMNFKPFDLKITENAIVTFDELLDLYHKEYSHLISIGLDEENMVNLFQQADINKNKMLSDSSEKQEFHAGLFKKLPRLSSWNILKSIHKQAYNTISFLELRFQGFRVLDDGIQYLVNLEWLDISHNLMLEEISSKISDLPLSFLAIDACPSLKTPPKEIIDKGLTAIMSYMRALNRGSVSCRRTKLMLVGLGGAGKTSLVSGLTESNQQESEKLVKSAQVTDGISIKKWVIQSIEYSIWDFAGQTVYYNTHQFFLSNRAVYFLVWNVRLGHEHAGLKFWLSSIECHAPKAPIFIVGTHIDQVEKSELPALEYQERYSQIKGFYYVSSLSRKGINELINGLVEITLNEKYMNEKIPMIWLDFEKQMFEAGSNSNLISIEDALKLAESSGIFNKAEFYQAVELLHELGSLLYFQNEFLRKKIVINPQWIVDVMACVVSIQVNAIKDGKLMHKDLSKIWPSESYAAHLHEWLLRLTEEFDLTFCLKTEKASLVPCLLPELEPKHPWEDEPLKSGEIQTKMQYNFDYLPSGLFNRAQVRLYQYSDESLIWKNGSFLRKNSHRGLLKKISSTTVLIEVRGLKPDNVLFLVHEVFETLIAEFFHGVRYDFTLPCPECIHQCISNPTMIPSSRIRKALQLKIPFLQCNDNFHTVSITQLQNMLPPDGNEEFDIHLQNAVRELKKIRSGLVTDIVMLYCLSDDPPKGSENSIVSATRIKNELEKAGFSIKLYNDSCEKYIEEAISSLKTTQVNLSKPNQLILIKKSDKWKQNTDIGMLCSDDIYINMQNVNNFSTKMNDLKKSLNLENKMAKEWPPCFISYCWSNSLSAIKKGTKMNESALGKTDPRQLKDKLEQAGIKCWMDVEQVGRGGLFQDIAEGLRKARIVVACVSDEYVSSKNCQMEFRFAAISLRLPIILAVVGTGKNWIKSEIGMISLPYSRVDLQKRDEDIVEVIDLVKEYLKTEKLDENKKTNSKTQKEANHEEFTELLELAERKLLRQLIILQDLSRGSNFPHIPILDYATLESKQYRFNFLCEHDEGWHLPADSKSIQWNIEPESMTAENYIKQWSPYLVRIYALLQHTSIPLLVFKSKEGASFIEQLQSNLVKKNEEKNLTIRDSYVSMIELIAKIWDRQYNSTSSNDLSKCHVSSGKTIWLCNYHQKEPRVTILQPDDVNISILPAVDNVELLEKVKRDNGDEIFRNAHSERAEDGLSTLSFYSDLSVVDSEFSDVTIKTNKSHKEGETSQNNSNKASQKNKEETVTDLISKGGRTKSRACVIV
ncbi:DgyrCDS9504 [Dimorphilus gyrociliatus]|uniref:non-specific serine/threonine protein kinase n=1 Tax=Dimorphilus gyrociliatus TaxID=2664684 RepID=A0A7I8VYU4_9ANNE|nr:DgyrCDS9504 [Dimorphilus gyrociliatus]